MGERSGDRAADVLRAARAGGREERRQLAVPVDVQGPQVGPEVDVLQGIEHRGRARGGGEIGESVGRPPADAEEERGGIGPAADQIGAAVGRGPEHHVRRREPPERLGELADPQAGHVGGDGDDLPVAAGAGVREGVGEPLGEIASPLGQGAAGTHDQEIDS